MSNTENIVRLLRAIATGSDAKASHQDTIFNAAADEIERLHAIAVERMELFKQAANDAERLSAALKPFADCVFNDNGDVTVTTSDLRIEDYMLARTALLAH